MSNIEVKISEVKNLSAELGPCYNKVSSIADSINSVRGNLDSRITSRRNIGSRLSSVHNEAKSIQSKLKALQKFIDESMNRYEKADKKVEEQANALRILMDLRMKTGMEFDLISQMSGTSSAYVSENDKIFYDGDKVSDDDEDIDEILKETDDLLKEINEEEDNDWRNKPAKEDIFDKFTDWLTEKLTGEKASPKTQGEEVIDAQLTTMSLDEQNILADIASDYQTAFRGLASADRINEALENFEEEPVFSSGNSTNELNNTEIKYEYNMIENPGPLSKMKGHPSANFFGGKYNARVLTEDKIYYRGGQAGKPFGQWFTSKPTESIAKARIDTAVKEQWINPVTGKLTGTSIIDTCYAIKIPKGTIVYDGPVGYQGGVCLGGKDIIQTFIPTPWKLNVEVVGSKPLK